MSLCCGPKPQVKIMHITVELYSVIIDLCGINFNLVLNSLYMVGMLLKGPASMKCSCATLTSVMCHLA